MDLRGEKNSTVVFHVDPPHNSLVSLSQRNCSALFRLQPPIQTSVEHEANEKVTSALTSRSTFQGRTNLGFLPKGDGRQLGKRLAITRVTVHLFRRTRNSQQCKPKGARDRDTTDKHRACPGQATDRLNTLRITPRKTFIRKPHHSAKKNASKAFDQNSCSIVPKKMIRL